MSATVTNVLKKINEIDHPLDVLEEYAADKDWGLDRLSETELIMQVPGDWCQYNFYFQWQDDMSAMQFCCQFDFKIAPNRRPAINELLSLINERMWLGHFDISSEDMVPLFRHNLLLRGDLEIALEQLDDVIEIALEESNRFYPAFQMVLWGGKQPPEAVSIALITPVGNA